MSGCEFKIEKRWIYYFWAALTIRIAFSNQGLNQQGEVELDNKIGGVEALEDSWGNSWKGWMGAEYNSHAVNLDNGNWARDI